ncbi:MAG: sporulation protein YqfD [Candidatus Pelethousia sp.]|nr:sporulation protein YqfD [Candidatus Pelethousia sp.]
MWNSLAGYVMIQVEGTGLERFVNRALREGLEIWEVSRTGRNTISAYVSVESFYALHKLNRGLHCRIRILEKHGLPIVLSRMRFRKVMAFGWLLVLAALLVASRFIWFLRIEGCDKVREEQIVQTLDAMGIHPGIRRGSITTSGLGQAVMATDSRIAWAGAELYGVVLQISIREASETPQVLEVGEPQSLYAAKDGVLRRITPLSGKALFNAGDAVLKGQELITGNLGNGIAVQARGEAVARVLYRFSYTAPYEQVLPSRNGNVFTYTELSLRGHCLPSPSIPFSTYEQERGTEYTLPAGLPIQVVTITCHELADQPRILTEAELLPLAQAGAQNLLDQGVDHSARILSVQSEQQTDETGVTVILNVIAEENIAQSGALHAEDE